MNQKHAPVFIYGTAWKKEATKELVLKALAAGFRAIDTANQPKHYSEPLVGEALKAHFAGGGKREDIFIQTKFTPADGQDSRVPYDPHTDIPNQVRQSFSASLNNLGVEHVDSYLLHGPYGFPDIGEEDLAVWGVLEELHQSKKAGLIGVSNFNHLQLEHLLDKSRIKPMVVQNRCFAERGWDREVRSICRDNGIVYQGFSLLTANLFVWRSRPVAELSSKYGKTPAQIIFRFSRQIGILPLTGTSGEPHMRQDLDTDDFHLAQHEVDFLQNIAGARGMLQ